jgi:hypothetical protein
MGRRARLLALTLAVALAPFAPSCGGAGGGGGQSPTDPGPSPSPSATPSPTPTPSPTASPTPTPGAGVTFPAASAGPGVVMAQGAATTSSSLVVEVRAAQVNGLYAVAFDLDYPAAVLRYQSSAAGAFLGPSGQVSLQVAETQPGHLVVGLSRVGNVAGVSGSGVLLQLVFSPVASGSGAFTFSRNTAFGSDGRALSVPWAAGTVTVAQ